MTEIIEDDTITTDPVEPKVDDIEAPPPDGDDQTTEDDAETFPREYVEKLRGQSAKYRDRAKVADTLAARLHTQLVKATGRLADPTDLPFDDAHLEDTDALADAIDDLLERKPHLASRKVVGDIGQGQRGGTAEPFSLLGMLKERT